MRRAAENLATTGRITNIGPMRRAWLGLLTSLLLLGTASRASADESVIKNPGDHPAYTFEAEPHALIGYGLPFRNGGEVGIGFRGTVIVADRGFIPSINNSVGVTFGADVFLAHGEVLLPVAMQWNFWLTTHWSVFGEPGLALAVNRENDRSLLHPIFNAGGRYHFTDKIALTLRIGYPSISVGASFFF